MMIFTLVGRLFGSQRQSALSFLFPMGLMLLVLTSFYSCGSNQNSSSRPKQGLEGSALTGAGSSTHKGAESAPLGSDLVIPVKSGKSERAAPPMASAQGDEELIQAALAEANKIRHENELPELTLDSQIGVAAQRHAVDMERRNYFEHKSPEGESPFDRMRKAGVSFRAAAENIAMGVQSPQRVFSMWLDSHGHKKNLLNKNYRRHGIGYFAGHWVHVFAD